jgi:DNA polymerase IV (archaeal DinB-like DNA polymerase)
MLVDLDYFFAQLEEIRNPSIKDKPVVICVYSGRTPDSGAVSTANYKAREYGVKSGILIYQARRKLENVDAVFLPVDEVYYEEASDKIMDLLRKHADSFEQVGIDEAFLDVTQKTACNFQKARNYGQEIKDDLKAQQGLTCSIGVGPNKLIAKIAADSQKPDGLTVVTPEQVTEFLAPLPVSRLIGVGVKTTEKMKTLSINAVEDLAQYDVQKLVSTFGKKIGTYFHYAALGIDNEPVREKGEVESISRIATLKENTDDINLITEKTDQLSTEIQTEILQQGKKFKTIIIIGIMTDLTNRSKSKTLDTPTDDLELMKTTVKELFEQYLQESTLKIRRVGVKISNFSKEQRTQKQITSFFERQT